MDQNTFKKSDCLSTGIQYQWFDDLQIVVSTTRHSWIYVKYMHLSDMILKTLRDKLNTVELFIIDKVFMIYWCIDECDIDVLIFINLRLCEIFDTINRDNFFDKKYILFGDLLQFPLVKEQSPFVKMSRSEIHFQIFKYHGIWFMEIVRLRWTLD